MIFNLISKAKDLFYNNKTSGLSATNVQSAIDEIDSGLDTVNENLATKNLKTYIGYTQLGLTANNTLDEVITAMPTGSMLIGQIGASATNKLNLSLPVTEAGELVIKKSTSTQRGIAEFRRYSANEIWTNCYINGAFKGWENIAKENDLTQYLPLTGGILSGNTTVYNTEDNARVVAKTNAKELQMFSAQNGVCALYDATNKKYLMKSEADGTTVFNGNATTATRATEDGNGNNIVSKYATKEDLVNDIIFEIVSFANVTIESGKGESLNITKKKDGYTLLGMIGIYTASMHIVPAYWGVTDGANGKISIILRNIYTTSASTSGGTVTLIYKKN